MLNFESIKCANYKLIAGLDEAGRGCCAGPLVVACVIMPKDYHNDLINDSKKISPKLRECLYNEIINNAIEYQIITLPASYVDKNNPKKASRDGMLKCLYNLANKPDLVITDFEHIDNLSIPQINLVKGDSISFNVACASILAKVSRDRYMNQIDSKYSVYDFKSHKGYCTQKHNAMIERYGICPEHRLTYKNVAKALAVYNAKLKK
ncbi:ribonuclease HII [Mycoplasmopsis primatum]|uniref:ribonuclease HII n=1 Tax=Mycoplasmopsis primatum TaxID=55604 RepID=UPI0004976119|nr:ribonuclease HII [Mycoplasmopsis primatum]